MTSVSQQSQNPNQSSSNTSATSSVPSYASATKKAVSSPPVATGSSQQSPALAVSGAEPGQQNGKSSSTTPVNGRAAITPAVPSFTPAIATSNADHSRKSSVNLPANGGFSNGGPVGGQKAGIQFGSLADSPAASHSTPQIAQPTSSAPISIPGNPRVPSPAQSPSPIPIPAASGGGRPPSGLSSNGIAFGSLGGDGDRHMRQASGSHAQLNPGGQQPHVRRESSGEMGHQAPSGSARGGFQAGRGRGGGGYNNNNNGGSYQQSQMGFNPAQAQFRPNQPNHTQNRGAVPNFQPNRSQLQYPNSPHQAARSPALANSIPGTPNMGQAMPMQSPQQYGGYQQQHYMGGPQAVYHPSSFPSTSSPDLSYNFDGSTDERPSKNFRAHRGKKTKGHQQSRQVHVGNRRESSFGQNDGTSGHPSTPTNAQEPLDRPQRGQNAEHNSSVLPHPSNAFPTASLRDLKLDLSPATGNFEKYLTNRQNFQGYPGVPYDHRMGGMPMPGMQGSQYAPMQYQQMQYMGGQPQSPQPGYQQPYMPGQFNPSGPQPMSRTPSQISERPNSSLGQPQTPSQTPSTAHTPQQPKPSPATNNFQRPKSKAILIKRPDGGDVDLSALKAPASPAASVRSRTPPVASTPTPPPKSSTPLHQRTDSTATNTKTQEQIRNEFKEQMKKAAETEKAAESKTKEPEASVVPEAVKEEVKAKEIEPVAEVKPTDEEIAAAAATKKQEEEDAELERQIQEMEEAEAAREKAEEEMMVKRKAEKAIADKANAEKKKLEDEENDRKLREQEREMERLEDEREKKRLAAEAGESTEKPLSVAEALAGKKADTKTDAEKSEPADLAAKLSGLTLENDGSESAPVSDGSMGPPKLPAEKRGKPTALTLTPLNTKPIEPPQPSAALQSLKSARFLTVINDSLYPEGIKSPAPGVNSAVASKGQSFKYDTAFLMQFQKVFTEKPSMEFESQIKSLIGGSEPGSARAGSARGSGAMNSRSASNRNNNPPGGSIMGTFMAAKTLPPGTTSDQRFAIANNALARPAVNQMASFNHRSGGAPFGSNTMPRVPSTSNMGSIGPNSPRNSSTRGGGRNNSKRDYKQHEAQAAKTMPLTAGMDLKPIEVTATGWKPRSIVAQASVTGAAGPAPGAGGAGGHMEPDMVQRKVKAALNKMTPEKFDKIADQILAIAGQSKDEADGRTLRQVIQLTFEKATDEAHWASMYAKFCKRMLETMSSDIKDESILDKNGNVVSGGNLFRKYLLNRCQEEFERGWQVNLPDKPEGDDGESKDQKSEEATMLSDEYYIAAAAKRRGLGLVQFIGELYKLGMLTERIMHECVKKLVDYTGTPGEDEIESLTKLLKTIGANLDSTEKGHPMMDVYFTRIQAMMDTPDLPSRLRFMLMDIIDLRKKHWQSKETNKGPKTLDEIRAEAEAAAALKAAENARGNQRGGGGGGRLQGGRGDARNFSNQYSNQPPPDYNKNTVATDDLRRLGKSASTRNAGLGPSLGPTSLFSSRSNSGRKLGPGGAFGRGGEDSGASSRTGTPPQQKEKEPTATANAFAALQQLDDNNETPASPPSVKASPALIEAELESGAKESES